ncbi:signal peptide peptidase SppA [Rhodanobacter thiooxydans]|uniref:Signal peptide peptidase SppA n=1 Tax=Rhodanobacter thiooxydans TaxID=416169 RepID=A0A154QHV8_9GAMM|nr:signal peptide peptidase SppA [Rhodanobacter thiooxydans]EIL97719.1 signal peptide peptidase SppA, 67K type [Rhodanobacter thiooxydans LCS2]KZC23264.1 signal peptide peptidase SppA [Rhodanobacter thiooxydans]MCW0203906.1 signal peptide peptidase SppA [Rhodanobacter thiooxydans]
MTLPPPPPPRRHGFWAFLRTLGRGINLLRLVILNLVFFGVLGVLLLLLAAGVLGSRGARMVQDASVLVIRPQGQLVEQYSIDPLQRALASLSGEQPKQVQLRDLVDAIDAAAKDRRISRILLLPDELQGGGFAALREVGAALDRFRAAGKPVVAWAVNLDQGQYYLAAHADRLLVDPQGGVMITGLANYRLFYKDLLDKLGVDVHLFRVGEFKSAAEPYILDHASAEAKQADSYWMGGLWNGWLDEVAAMRKLDPATLRDDIDNLPQHIASTQGNLAQLALQQHLVDGLATRAELIAMMRREGVPADRKGHSFRQVDFARYAAALPNDGEAFAPGVAIVVAEGEIAGGKRAAGSIGGESTAALIREAREDRKTKALVLRVNSPGGEVYAAEQIRREIELTRSAGIPVVVSMGDVAASGGYWIAMNANRIYAEPNTITGSIGIFGMYYTVPNTLAKLGVRSDGVGTGPLAGAFDISRPLDPKVGTVIQAIIDKGYRDFVGNVARARGKSYEAIDAIAQGRVWTGRQALERGLVDQLGGLRDAVADAASLAKLGKGYPVRYVEAPLGGFERFLLGMNQNAAMHVLQSWGVRLPDWFARLPALAPELELLRQAKAGTPNIYADCLCRPR